jgi:hypothetical protein
MCKKKVKVLMKDEDKDLKTGPNRSGFAVSAPNVRLSSFSVGYNQLPLFVDKQKIN